MTQNQCPIPHKLKAPYHSNHPTKAPIERKKNRSMMSKYNQLRGRFADIPNSPTTQAEQLSCQWA
uniref:Uncharacterized protein n=1 Tax=Triticum urartu TaxID=4572 RepID=A0A8R7Q142_TRIUA